MIFIQTQGLTHSEMHAKWPVPLYLTDDLEVIEGPSYWAMSVAQKRTKSVDTLKQYTTTLAAFLQWLDDEADEGAKNWECIDQYTIDEYIADLIEDRDDKGRPNDSTIQVYISRLGYFYKWAKEQGNNPYWEFNEETVKMTISNKNSMVRQEIEVQRRPIKIQNGATMRVERERDKVLRREWLPKIYASFDDIAYRLIAHILYSTGLRPKEFFQLPFLGQGLNVGLRRYRDEELDIIKPILFEFESKGKRRSIEFPPELWAYICKVWMPIRTERAEKYRQKHGVVPPNKALFLSKEGRIITRKMLRDNFNNAAAKDSCPVNHLYPYQLRHTFATYFIYDRLKALNQLGKEYAYNAVIDHDLRKWMGHEDINTTYKFYVVFCNRFAKEDLLTDLDKAANKELFDAIVKM